MNAPLNTRSPDLAWRELHEQATAPYKASGNFGWHFARGKLGHDPAFRGIVSRGLIGSARARMLDIGSGQSLFANVLHTAAHLQRQGRWPAEWPPLPAPAQYTGIELMPRDVARAQAAVGHIQPAPRLVCGNMCTADLPACDVVVILDVLHYVDHAAQEAVLARVREALLRGAAQRPADVPGRLLLRVGDAASRRGFAISQWVDRTVTRIRGHKVSPTWGRTLDQWLALLLRMGFAVQPIPMSEGTPFANVLLVADAQAEAGA
ncbi:class I SAM-dependent methyltransferase [Xenophilus arseniciresistens]|uniref:Class I SAM-dependent methyltransferase n=1 Tax=Xenophilus arseniciresistens TaxID=1283306 RepID=A0AAE3T0G8_9BURK|nr:class I SAM-dependent methyltransferase [Xenophilus arseniciresistens]MDA7418202.1 class I SAM-dependent methyltransferase [Xenophilus arseniciresistens]